MRMIQDFSNLSNSNVFMPFLKITIIIKPVIFSLEEITFHYIAESKCFSLESEQLIYLSVL